MNKLSPFIFTAEIIFQLNGFKGTDAVGTSTSGFETDILPPALFKGGGGAPGGNLIPPGGGGGGGPVIPGGPGGGGGPGGLI